MGYPQQETSIQTDNSTADGIVNNTIYQKSVKAMGMRFYWVQDIIRYDHHNRFWKPGANNLDNYFTKNHPPCHHRQMRPAYLHYPVNVNNASAGGCYYV